MLYEYALIPDIFDSTCYTVSTDCPQRLQDLKEILLQEALVRDLRAGEWREYVNSNLQRFDIRAKELLRKLINQKRLRSSVAISPTSPANYDDWCKEAIVSNNNDPLTAIIVAKELAQTHASDPAITSIEKLSSAGWWRDRSPSRRLKRITAEYLTHLKLVLEHANSLMFIDPYLDPTKTNYNQFGQIVQAIRRTSLPPLIEIHRACYEGSGPNRTIISSSEWESRFRNVSPIFTTSNLQAKVFVWDDFHDRYLISDLIGIQLPNGFDISVTRNVMTTWTRLGRNDRDDVQREFDPASNRHRLHHQFEIP